MESNVWTLKQFCIDSIMQKILNKYLTTFVQKTQRVLYITVLYIFKSIIKSILLWLRLYSFIRSYLITEQAKEMMRNHFKIRNHSYDYIRTASFSPVLIWSRSSVISVAWLSYPRAWAPASLCCSFICFRVVWCFCPCCRSSTWNLSISSLIWVNGYKNTQWEISQRTPFTMLHTIS